MSVWDAYKVRIGATDDPLCDPKQSSTRDRVQDYISRKITASLSYETVDINGSNKRVAIVNINGNLSLKKIFSLPGESLPHGEVIDWENSKWLITEVDAHKVLYTEGRMSRCNYYLKWLDDSGNIVGRWCIVEDGTKYLIGEKSNDMMTIGDARISVTIGKDEATSQLRRGKRFLIDDMDSEEVLAYQITKPNKLFNVYNGAGVFRFILNEVNLTDNDNVDLRIADYYNWTPRLDTPRPDVQTDISLEDIVSNANDNKENMSETIRENGRWI